MLGNPQNTERSKRLKKKKNILWVITTCQKWDSHGGTSPKPPISQHFLLIFLLLFLFLCLSRLFLFLLICMVKNMPQVFTSSFSSPLRLESLGLYTKLSRKGLCQAHLISGAYLDHFLTMWKYGCQKHVPGTEWMKVNSHS